MRNWAFVCLLALSCTTPADESAKRATLVGTTASFDFAVVGDNPYSAPTYDRYLELIDDVNETNPPVEWVVHLGDLKGGGDPCTDEELRERFELNQRFEPPFVLTPGDNDWYDCVQEGAGGFNDYERLDFLRKVFFADPSQATGGAPMSVESQAGDEEHGAFVENALWERSGVVFATVHLVAATRPPTDLARDEARAAAAQSWIRAAFERARTTDASGLFLATQADPWPVQGSTPILQRLCPQCLEPRGGLDWLEPLLVEELASFDRPVVLAVGDTHIFRVDKPLRTRPKEPARLVDGRLVGETPRLLTQFTRLETFGFPDVHWVRVRVDPSTPWVFSFHQQLVE